MSQFYQRRAKPDIQSESLGQSPNSLPSVSDAPVRAGDVLADKYRVERILGTGGMGVVVAARNVGLGKPVAIKMMLPSMLATPRAIERFEREARAVVQLKSEHVAEVLDIGKLSNGAPYIVMELLEGSDFEELLRERTFAIEEAIAYVLQACEAIAEAHSLGIVHRDLKPRNLFLTRRLDGTPLVKVLDFGISKWTPADAEAHSLTRTSDVIGSPNYMSPEQIRSAKDVDARTDIWSLGIIVFELLTGRVPFLAEGLPHLCALILEQDAPLVSTLRPDVPAELVTIVARCLDRDPEKRFQSVAELVLALKPFAPSSPSASHGQQLTSSSPRGSWAPSRLASTGSPVANAPGATPRPSSSARVHVGNGNPDWERAARTHADQLEPNLPRLTVLVPPEARLEGLVIARDGHEVDTAEWDTAIPVDAGVHTVRARAPGKVAWSIQVTVASAGERKEVTIPLLANEPRNDDVNPIRSGGTMDDAPRREGGSQRLLGIVVASAGGLGLATGVVLGLFAKSTHDEALGYCNAARQCDQRGIDLDETASSQADASTIALVVGATLVAGGGVLYLTAPRARQSASKTLRVSVGGPGQIRVNVGGTF